MTDPTKFLQTTSQRCMHEDLWSTNSPLPAIYSAYKHAATSTVESDLLEGINLRIDCKGAHLGTYMNLSYHCQ